MFGVARSVEKRHDDVFGQRESNLDIERAIPIFNYAVLLICYILAGFTHVYGLRVESVPFNWGWLTIAAAFALFALAFSIRRRELGQSESAP